MSSTTNTSTTANGGGSSVRRWLATGCRWLVAVILLLLAGSKAIGGWQARYATPALAYHLATAAELAVALLLLAPSTATFGRGLCCVLMLAFGAWTIGSGNVGDCGCFGDVLPATPANTTRLAAILGGLCIASLLLDRGGVRHRMARP